MKARIQYDHIRDLHAIPNNDPKLKVSHYANTHSKVNIHNRIHISHVGRMRYSKLRSSPKEK